MTVSHCAECKKLHEAYEYARQSLRGMMKGNSVFEEIKDTAADALIEHLMAHDFPKEKGSE